MRSYLAGLMLVLALPTLAGAQTTGSTLNFPRLFLTSEFSSTGFAVVNPMTSTASVTFTLYNANGGIVATTSRVLQGGEQLAVLASELFPVANSGGWVQATSSNPGLYGFWLGGDFFTFMDGAAAAPEFPDHFLPVTDNTEVNLANSGTSEVHADVHLYSASGTELAPSFVLKVAPKAIVQRTVSSLFPTANLSQASHVRMTCTQNFATVAVIRGWLVDTETAVVNGMDAGFFLTGLRFPHVINGNLGSADYVTQINVINMRSTSQTVTLRFYPVSGSPITLERQVPGNGSIRDSLRSLFNLPGTEYSDGWLKVEAPSGVAGMVVYADRRQGGMAAVPFQAPSQRNIIFGHIADLSPWWTGVSLLNDNTGDADVDIAAFTPQGVRIGTTRITVKAGTKIAKLLSELIPQTQTRTSDGGFVTVRSTAPLYGLELFFNRNLSVVSNVAGGTLP